MIKTFEEVSKVLWFPVKWANSVATWLMNISSPNGTIDIENTITPSESNACKIDINAEKTADLVIAEIQKRIDEGTLSFGVGTFGAKPVVTDGVVTGIQFGTSEQLSAGSQSYTVSLGDTYGIRCGFSNYDEETGIPMTIDWIAVGPKSALDTYSGEQNLGDGLKIPIFSSQYVTVMPGNILQGYFSASPVKTGNEITGIKFGTYHQIMAESANCEIANIGGNGKYGVIASFDNDGVLTGLSFGSEKELDESSGNVKTVSTVKGCPYKDDV